MRNFVDGIVLYNEGRFFEAHEAWEHEWLAAPEGAEKQLLQCLIMLAAALYKFTNREILGTLKMLKKCGAALKALPFIDVNIDLDSLRNDVNSFFRRFVGCSLCVSEEDIPRIKERTAVRAA
jgi:predicted metal-dependent hydrolase